MTLRLLTLGGIDLRSDDGLALGHALKQPKRAALLYYLALREPAGFIQRNVLLPIFWPEADEARARGSLRNSLHFLRAALGADALLTRGDEEIALNPARVWCDTTAFEQAISASRFEEALSLYRGPLLDGFLPPRLPEFTDWLDRRRQAVQWKAADAALHLVEAAHSSGAAARAIPYARRWMELAPFEERAARAVAESLLAAGDQSAALSELESWSARLARELGGAPSRETAQLMQSLRAAVPAVTSPHAAISVRPAIALNNLEERAAAPVGQVQTEVIPSLPAPTGSPWKRWLRPGSAAVVVLVVAVVTTWQAIRSRPPAPSENNVVAVMPFTYGGAAQYDHLSAGVVDLFSSGISGMSGMRVIDPRAVLTRSGSIGRGGVTPDPKRAAVTARRLGANYFVLGSMVEINGRVSLSAALYDVLEPEPVSQVTLSGGVNDLFELVDQASFALFRTYLPGLRGAPGSSAQVHTRSHPALRAYIDGELAFISGRYDSAAIAYRRATELDTTFARAFLRLSMAANLAADYETSKSALGRTAQLLPNLRAEERILAQAWIAHQTGSATLADSLYSAYLRAHPEDADAWLQLGEVRFHWGPLFGIPVNETEQSFTRALDLLPEHAGALSHLLRLRGRRGDAAGTRAFADRLLARQPVLEEAVDARAVVALVSEDSAALTLVLRSFQELPQQRRFVIVPGILASAPASSLSRRLVQELLPTLEREHALVARLLLADLAMARGQIDRAATELAANTGAPALAAEWRAMHATLPFTAVDTTRARAALAALRRAADAPMNDATLAIPEGAGGIYPPSKLLLEGLLALRLRDSVTSERVQRDLAALPEGMHGEYGENALRILRAASALHRNDARAALIALGEPRVEPHGSFPRSFSWPKAFERWYRAEALEKTGDARAALRWYRTFPDHSAYDLPFVAPADLRAAALLEQQGAVGEASVLRRRAGALKAF